MIYILLTILLVAADQITKLLTVAYIKPVSSIEIIKGILSFTYVENRGAAFGIMQNSRWFFIVFTLAVIIGIAIYCIKANNQSRMFYTAATLVCSGGIGNLADRIFRGYVVDMIQVTFVDYPVFNFADICVVCGAVLICICVLFDKQHTKPLEK